ncbi:MAG: NAD-dependent epimerase/dehydratase family protein [Cellvibrionaceae bacterium]
MLNVLLTGATGFVGGHTLECLQKRKYNVTVLGRKECDDSSLGSPAEYFKGIDVVIHCAACTNIIKKDLTSDDVLNEFRRVNTYWTLDLAKKSAAAGVKRFIFISTIKVNGESTKNKKAFTLDDNPVPVDSYGRSKYEAEQGLFVISQKTGMEVVIVRPPLVYGSRVKGNFSSIINAVRKSIPLPLGSITENRRSFLALDNLVDFISLCVDYKKSPKAANQVFFLSDGEDISTAELFKRIATAYNKKSFLFPFPVLFLSLSARVLGGESMVNRLIGSLQVENSKARKLLGWKPIITMDEQLRKMAEVGS